MAEIFPPLSVVMSVYNEERFLEKAIKSILNQTFQDFEFIIIDDASTDKTLEILENFRRVDPRICLITNPVNMGKSRSLNKAINQAKGRYIALMDGDDISLPRRLEKQYHFLEGNRHVGLVGVRYNEIDEEDDIVNEIFYPDGLDSKKLKKILLRRNLFAGGSLMFRKEVFEQVGGFNEHFWVSEDYDFILRVCEVADVAIIDEVLYLHRIKPSGLSFTAGELMQKFHKLAVDAAILRSKGRDSNKYVAEVAQRLLDEFKKSPESQEKLQKYYCQLLRARIALRKGNTRKARFWSLTCLKSRVTLRALRLLILSFLPPYLYRTILTLVKKVKLKLQKWG